MNPFRSWLGVLNFLVLQWFGVRLARVTKRQLVWKRSVAKGEIVVVPFPLDFNGMKDVTVLGTDIEERELTVGWRFLRWIVPLTGWWSDYRYIARRPTA